MSDWKRARLHGPSRWNAPVVRSFLPGVPPTIAPCSDAAVLDAISLRVRLEEVQQAIQNGGRQDMNDPSIRRSPEPTPQYDSKGVRVNTREKVQMDKLLWERQSLVLSAQKLNPHFVAPTDFRMMEQRLTMKIFIPYKEYPDYNFIGLIIGPRGLTQKQMEKDTGCRIAIRGKGSSKDARLAGDEELHVLLTAPDATSMKKAEQMVRKLMTPVDEQYNEHKRQQLRKLAEINGTLADNRDDGGDQQQQQGGGGGRKNNNNANNGNNGSDDRSMCRNCGSVLHATYACVERGGDRVGIASMSVKDYFNQEYIDFCKLIGETPLDDNAQHAHDADQAIHSFYQELAK